MSKSASIPIDPQDAAYVERQIEDGHYGSATEVVHAALLLMKEHEDRVTAIREALIEGEESGEPEPFDLHEFLQEMRREPL